MPTLLLNLQYFLPFGLDSINNHIENSILDADAKGVKVLSLAALNKVNYSKPLKSNYLAVLFILKFY
jgi:hypothetical protein